MKVDKQTQSITVTGCKDCPFCHEYDHLGCWCEISLEENSEENEASIDSNDNGLITPEWCPIMNKGLNVIWRERK